MQFGRSKAFNGYISKERTNSIKGIFILLVFFRHIDPYIKKEGYSYDSVGDAAFSFILSSLGQLIVVMFLFYSGYGVMESIKKKGVSYISSFPKRRILTTLLNFDVAVCAFLIIDLLLDREVSMSQFFLSLLAWESIGNSNWYIFVVLICYLSTWIIASFLIKFKKWKWKNICGIINLLFLTVVIFLLMTVKESYWYDTILAYPAGIIYSVNKDKIEQLLDGHYYVSLISLIALYVFFKAMPIKIDGLKTDFYSVIFALMIVTLSMRIKVDNRMLQWCGVRLFPLYIYQRIPMIIVAAIAPKWWLQEFPLIYISICLTITILIALLYKYWSISLN